MKKYFCEVRRYRSLITTEVRDYNCLFCVEIFEGRFSSQKHFIFFTRDEFFNLVKNRNRENVASVRFSGRIPG